MMNDSYSLMCYHIVHRLGIMKKGGPDGKLRKVFEEASGLPRRQQEKIMEFVPAFINQYKQSQS